MRNVNSEAQGLVNDTGYDSLARMKGELVEISFLMDHLH